MTEKRFTFADGFKIVAIRDNGEIMNSIRVCDKLNELYEENKQCKEYNAKLYSNSMKSEKQLLKQIKELEEENKQLQERNNRQAKQLNDLYKLITEKDWRALSDIMDDFQKAEEQLQSEWQTYGDEND